MEIKVTSENFKEEVLGASLPVLIDFYADWCGPCKMMAPIVERIAEEMEGKILVGKCDVDAAGDIAREYRVMSIPTIILFKDGEPVMTSIGAMAQSELEAKISAALA